MSTIDSIQKVVETLGATATVKSVFGEPIEANGKLIVPVAKVAYGFGGGFGTGRDRAHTDEQGEGGGGGARVRALPVGALEVTDGNTRFVQYIDRQRLVTVVAASLVLGALVLARVRA